MKKQNKKSRKQELLELVNKIKEARSEGVSDKMIEKLLGIEDTLAILDEYEEEKDLYTTEEAVEFLNNHPENKKKQKYSYQKMLKLIKEGSLTPYEGSEDNRRVGYKFHRIVLEEYLRFENYNFYEFIEEITRYKKEANSKIRELKAEKERNQKEEGRLRKENNNLRNQIEELKEQLEAQKQENQLAFEVTEEKKKEAK